MIRHRSVSNVIGELRTALAAYRYRYLDIVDDCFTWDRRWLRDFCTAYGQSIGVPFACQAIPGSIDAEVADMLALAGCSQVAIGCQSVSQDAGTRILNRKLDLNRVAAAVACLKKAGIYVQVDHLLGIPGESPDVLEEALRFYNTSRPNCISVFWLQYYPKTQIVETAIAEKAITEQDRETIEEGINLTGRGLHTGGSMSNPRPLYCFAMMMNYLPLLGQSFVALLIKTRLYRVLRIGNYYLATAVPRAINSLLHRKAISDRALLRQFVRELIPVFNGPRSARRSWLLPGLRNHRRK